MMKRLTAFPLVAALTLLVLATSCQQSTPQAAALTSEDIAAVGKTIDAAIEAYVAKDLDRHMQFAAADAIGMEYDERFQGIDEIREKHIKPEFAEMKGVTYKAADRIVRGHSGLAYVSERNIIEFQDKEGKTFSTSDAWASYVMEKQQDGLWKCKQSHWSGPMNWVPKVPGKIPAKK
jgi:ketosteroid isomerase-like protein